MKQLFIVIYLSAYFALPAVAQSDKTYKEAYKVLKEMLENNDLDLKKAVFTVENAWYEGQMDYKSFCRKIDTYVSFCNGFRETGNLFYDGKDSTKALAQGAVFAFMTESLPLIGADDRIVYHQPFNYNFDDYSGEQNWTNMFVTTLMATKQGNCHSMPLLYKIIMEEMGEQAWLALAPNHMYIKVNNLKVGWHNIELTGGDFPTDAWIMASGYIHLDAIRSGIYMDTLSQQQSVALCLADLAMGYQRKFPEQATPFVLQCCRTVLQYYPNYINALLLRAETTAKIYKESLSANPKDAESLLKTINGYYAEIHKLGFRKMPKAMYLNWLLSLSQQSAAYHNKKITIFERTLTD